MEYLRRYILFRSSLSDLGGSPDDERFPPGGEIHAKSMARHLSRLGVITSNVDLLECFGWHFGIRIHAVSFLFVLQQYADAWLVLYEWGFFAKIVQGRSVATAIRLIENGARDWQPEGGQITNLRFFSRREFDKYNLRSPSET